MPVTKGLTHTINRRAKARHHKKTYKMRNSKKPMDGGGFFDWFRGSETKFAYILADHAMTCNYALKESDSFDDKTKLLLLHAFRKLFKNFVNTYKGAEIKSGGNSETIKNILNSIEFTTISNGKYEIKYRKNSQNDVYVKKIKDSICNFITKLTYTTTSDRTTDYYYNENNKLQEPVISKKSNDKYSMTKFYGGQDVGAVEVINILYKLNYPDVPASETNKKQYRIKMRHQITEEFNNNISKYSQAFYTYLSYLKSKS